MPLSINFGSISGGGETGEDQRDEQSLIKICGTPPEVTINVGNITNFRGTLLSVEASQSDTMDQLLDSDIYAEEEMEADKEIDTESKETRAKRWDKVLQEDTIVSCEVEATGSDVQVRVHAQDAETWLAGQPSREVAILKRQEPNNSSSQPPAKRGKISIVINNADGLILDRPLIQTNADVSAEITLVSAKNTVIRAPLVQKIVKETATDSVNRLAASVSELQVESPLPVSHQLSE